MAKGSGASEKSVRKHRVCRKCPGLGKYTKGNRTIPKKKNLKVTLF